MDNLRDVLKSLEVVIKIVLCLILFLVFMEILNLIIPNKRFSITNLPFYDYITFVYLAGLVIFVLRYVLSGRTSLNLDKDE